MTITIRLTHDRRTRRDFLALPHRLYRGDPNWVSPLTAEVARVLDVSRNPYFREAQLRMFVGYRDSEAVARTTIVIDRKFEEKYHRRTAFFGFFECIDDADVVARLFSEAEAFCMDQGAVDIEGPFSPNHYSELGVLLNGFDRPPAFFQAYNPPHYVSLLRAVGFEECHRIFTARSENIAGYLEQRYGPPCEAVPPGGFTADHLNLANLAEELESIRQVFNDAFEANWHFLPLTHEEYVFSTSHFREVTRRELVTIVRYHGAPVGASICVLDVNPILQRMYGRMGILKYIRFRVAVNRSRRLIIYAVGVRKAFQKDAVVLRLLLDSLRRMISRFEALETTWISPDNHTAVKCARAIGLKPDKYFAIFRKTLRGGTPLGAAFAELGGNGEV
jgi:hypothetical protein